MFDSIGKEMTDATAFDVAVVGAGPAGSAIASWLAQAGCPVLLIERSTFEAMRVGETLAPSVQPLLTELGVWNDFIALDPLPSWGVRSVWGAEDPQVNSHLMSPYGNGWHIDRKRFDQMLANAAVAAGAILLLRTRLIKCIESGLGTWDLTLSQNQQTCHVTARVVIDATGRGARLAQQLGAKRFVFDALIGVAVLFSNIPSQTNGFALIETSPDGWWYSAPVGGDQLVTMLMTDSDLCGQVNLTLKDNWYTSLQSAPNTAARVGNAPRVYGPRVFSAVSQRLCRTDMNARWLAVGDGALAVDPVSGSGVLRALRTARTGAIAALELLEGNSPDTIENYEADLDHKCTQYLQEHAKYYGMEHRWLDSPFWQRRVAIFDAALN
jgi:flavin-dependent dehydrogenase